MRAAVVQRIGEPPQIQEVPEPQRGEGQALVEVTAAPLNPVDLSIAAGRYFAGSPETPYVAGREGVGRVLEAESLPAVSRVYFDAARPGTFAERVVIDEEVAVPLPEGVDDALAGCFGIAGLAAWLALEDRARLGEGEHVLVLGASGPVGLIAVQAARLMGAGRVVAAARRAESLQRARELGADEIVGMAEVDDVVEAFSSAAGGRIDVVVDPLWGEPAMLALRALSPYGRLAQIGQSAGAEASVPSSVVRGKPATIVGHTNFAVPHEVRHRALRTMLEHAAAQRLTVDYETVPLDDVARAWEMQASSPRRKLVLVP
jgi:NADPH2:quinone reductase